MLGECARRPRALKSGRAQDDEGFELPSLVCAAQHDAVGLHGDVAPVCGSLMHQRAAVTVVPRCRVTYRLPVDHGQRLGGLNEVNDAISARPDVLDATKRSCHVSCSPFALLNVRARVASSALEGDCQCAAQRVLDKCLLHFRSRLLVLREEAELDTPSPTGHRFKYFV